MTSSSPSSQARIRPATLADRDAWVRVQISGYELDHQFRWRYPWRKEFPEDARRGTGDEFDACLEKASTTCLVAELPRVEERDGGVEMETKTEWVVVAIAVWEWKDWKEVESGSAPIGFSSPTSGRRDMDPARQKLFMDTITAAEKSCFGPEWGAKRLELADMAADARYHRRGAGKALMEWGLQQAKKEHVPITLTASPMGRFMYQSLGFKDLLYFECGIEGEEERVGTWVMVWVPEGWEKDSKAPI